MNSWTRKAIRGLLAVIVLTAGTLLGLATEARAQNYPSRDITLIVPYNPGGGTDPIARQFAGQLEKELRGNVNVENKPGGSGTIGAGVVVRAKPDGYTIGLGSNTILGFQPLVNTGLAFKKPDDYQPIVKLMDQYVNLVVRADAPWKTFDEFMADVRKNPGKIRASVSGKFGQPDLVVQQLNKAAGVKITTVPFTGGAGEALVALLGGRVEANIGTAASTLGHIKAGTIRALAVFKKGKHDLFPNAAPVGDTYDATIPSAYYVIAPKGMPKEVLDKLVAASLRVVRSQEYLKFCLANGYDVDPKGPEALTAEIAQYLKTFTELNKFLDLK
jgi:tripartite-type tricarboxylate transporter receptor subunit TctC